MTSLTVVACAGSALLVVVAALPAVATARRATTLLALAAAIGMGALAVHWLLGRSEYLPDNAVSRIANYGIEQIRAWNENPTDNLVVIEGGSYAARAVDPQLLRKELARLGYDARVVQLSLGAGNHFERYQLLRDVFTRASPEDRPGGQERRLVMLAEVQGTYDQTPLAQLDKNRETDRTYQYLTPSNAWHATRAFIEAAAHSQRVGWQERAQMLWLLGQTALINGFNVGVGMRVAPPKRMKSRSGFVRGLIERGYKFKDLRGAISAAEAPLEKRRIGRWLLEDRRERIRSLWDERLDRWVYFSVPSTRGNHIAWTRSFCRGVKGPCFAADDVALLRRLEQKRYWRDRGHLTYVGAAVYTRWLAQRLATSDVLLKRSTPPKASPKGNRQQPSKQHHAKPRRGNEGTGSKHER